MYDQLIALMESADELEPSPWRVTHRSSPGWRIESADGVLMAFGPDSSGAHWVAQARNSLPIIAQEMARLHMQCDMVLDRLADLEAENQQLYNRNSDMCEVLSDIYAYMSEFNEPDWFIKRAEEVRCVEPVG